MNLQTLNSVESDSKVEPLCPVFGICGGCAYQDIVYAQELVIKENFLRQLMNEKLNLDRDCFEPIVSSPNAYHYRSRLDLTLRRSRGEILIGFQFADTHRTIPVDACAIALKEISDFIPRLKKEAQSKLPEKYRVANLVVKTGDNGRVVWGGIGRRSLNLDPRDYLWTEINGKRIYYSLDTFFQANLSILPKLMNKIEEWVSLDRQTIFYDLYAGVGLFGIYFADKVQRVVMIEENVHAEKLMKLSAEYNQSTNLQFFSGRVESELLPMINELSGHRQVLMVDPPRKGLSREALELLLQAKGIQSLLYLSCHPESLVRDLTAFIERGWRVEKVVPFDFFPKTVHLETLVLLKP